MGNDMLLTVNHKMTITLHNLRQVTFGGLQFSNTLNSLNQVRQKAKLINNILVSIMNESTTKYTISDEVPSNDLWDLCYKRLGQLNTSVRANLDINAIVER